MGCVRLTALQYNKYFIGRFSFSKTILEIRMSQNLIKPRGGPGGGVGRRMPIKQRE